MFPLSAGLNSPHFLVSCTTRFCTTLISDCNTLPQFTEALEALLNRIQVDIEVDSNLQGLRKGSLEILNNFISQNCSL